MSKYASVSITGLHELTGMARETIRKRLRRLEPISQRANDKRYDPQQAIPLLYLATEEGNEDGPLDLTRERAHLAKQQRLAQEMKNAEQRGELISVSEVRSLLDGCIAAARARLMTLPTKAAPRVVGEDVKVIQATLDEIVRETLTELAKAEYEDPDESE